jgi:hypothetical protein
MTLDLDVATEASAQEALIAFMESQGFVTLHRSPGYSNHRHPRRGRVDFMYVRGETADRLFGSATELPGPAVDIAYLLQVDGVDRDEVRGYIVRAGLEDRWHELTRKR